MQNEGDIRQVWWSCKAPKYSIISISGYGPIFGGGHDIAIFNYSNLTHLSYSNFYHSYKNDQLHLTHDTQEAKSFLAGSYNFLITEIEVFKKTSI